MTWIENNFHQPCDLGPRQGLPEEIASITTYLASKRNGYVTGATVNVDGGSDFVSEGRLRVAVTARRSRPGTGPPTAPPHRSARRPGPRGRRSRRGVIR